MRFLLRYTGVNAVYPVSLRVTITRIDRLVSAGRSSPRPSGNDRQSPVCRVCKVDFTRKRSKRRSIPCPRTGSDAKFNPQAAILSVTYRGKIRTRISTSAAISGVDTCFVVPFVVDVVAQWKYLTVTVCAAAHTRCCVSCNCNPCCAGGRTRFSADANTALIGTTTVNLTFSRDAF